MSNNYLPSLCGQLSISFQPEFKAERQLHVTDTYLELLESARANLKSTDGCCYCGFRDGRFLELHHLDDNHDNNENDNFRFICTLCHRLKHLGWVGTENLGKILYIPRPTNLKDDAAAMWLEPLNIIQRFYLMKRRLNISEQTRLEKMELSGYISAMLTAMKRQDINDNYLSIKEAKARRAEEIDELRNASAEDKEKVAQAIEARRKSVVEDVVAESYFHDLHLLDLLQAITDSSSGAHSRFLKEQSEGKYGRLAIWFNESVFTPFEPNPDYTLEERLDYYNETNLFTANGLASIMHNLRLNHQFNLH